MNFENDTNDHEQFAFETRVQLQATQRLVNALLLVGLRNASDPQAFVEQLRKYAFLANAADAPELSDIIEFQLATLENIGLG